MRHHLLFLPLVLAAVASLCSCSMHGGCSGDLCTPPESAFKKLPSRKAPSGHDYPVYRTKKAAGPPILVLHEVNGLAAAVPDFCLELETHGWTAYAPLLWGKYGQDDLRDSLKTLEKDRCWNLHDPQSSGPIVKDLARMVEWISREHGGRRVVVMGNCLTGAFPLALLGHPKVRAGILCQPAMPVAENKLRWFLGLTSREFKRSLAISDRDLNEVLQAMRQDSSKQLTGFHYLEDWIAPLSKFDLIHEKLTELGLQERFHPVVMVPRGSHAKKSWWKVETTTVPRNLKGPHNTVTAGGSRADREHLRKLLLAWLEPLKSKA
ncbi:MAG: dienelactone hydrolase family protein [Prosthecobacter sp.]